MSSQHIKLPISIVKAVGAYTTKLFIGSEQSEVNVMLDTGSSTLAIDLSKYKPETDQHLMTSQYAQDVTYGDGGWAGPVIHTQVKLDHSESITLNQAPIAITSNSQQNNFQQADGIWGLGYHHLNKAYDVTSYLSQQQPVLKATYPWPFVLNNDQNSIGEFKKYLRGFPEHDITPLFTAFEKNQVTPNQFALQTQRSIVYVPNQTMTESEIADEPMNQGCFYIGYDINKHPGSYQTSKVVHDAYYNVDLKSIRVEGFDAQLAPALDQKHLNSFFSNAIVDSGCSFLVLQHTLFQYVMDCLNQIKPEYKQYTDDFFKAFQSGQDYQNPQINLQDWPNLYLTFASTDQQPIELLIKPQEYWQNHAKGLNNWMFMIMNQLPHWPDQTICGLPLINSYFCVFDRSDTSNGAIHWLDKSLN